MSVPYLSDLDLMGDWYPRQIPLPEVKGPPKEPQLPNIIFGLSHREHRVKTMKAFIKDHGNHYTNTRSTKTELLKILHEMERYGSTGDKDMFSQVTSLVTKSCP